MMCTEPDGDTDQLNLDPQWLADNGWEGCIFLDCLDGCDGERIFCQRLADFVDSKGLGKSIVDDNDITILSGPWTWQREGNPE